MFLPGIYRCLEFSIKIIYYLQNLCFHGFATETFTVTVYFIINYVLWTHSNKSQPIWSYCNLAYYGGALPPTLIYASAPFRRSIYATVELYCEESTEILFETYVQSLQSDTVFLLGIYRYLEFSIKMIYYLQNPCFHGFATEIFTVTVHFIISNALWTHSNKWQPVWLIYNLAYFGGVFAPPQRLLATDRNRQSCQLLICTYHST